MVFFTCNACGTSLKKNQVEKHYQHVCPNCEVLSCIDCGLEFYGDAYASHTKCISEAEKYQGSLYKEGGAGKGERKQQEWVETVKQMIAASSFNPRITQLLERIAEYPNIPRKKAKFQNFVRSSCKVRDQRTITQVWDAFSAAVQQQKKQVESCSTSDQSSQVHSISCQEKSDSSLRGPNQFDNPDSKQSEGDRNEKKRKKKRKHNEEGEETVEQNGDVAGDTTAKNGSDSELHTKKKPKKKKKMKHKDKELEEHTPSGDDVIVGQSDENLSAAMPIKKKKKKHKRKHMEEDGVDTVMQNLQKDSGTKESDAIHAESHEAGVEDKGGGVDVLAAEELSSKKSHKRKHKEGKTPDSMDSQCSVLSTSSCTDDGILEPSTKKLKVDSPGLEFVRSKKSKHRHSHKS